VAFQGSDQGLEDDGEHGREGQREHDLADRCQGGDDDGHGHHEPYEAPGPDANLWNPAQRPRAVTRPRVAVSAWVGLVSHDQWSRVM
jgi:hypothetical protein